MPYILDPKKGTIRGFTVNDSFFFKMKRELKTLIDLRGEPFQSENLSDVRTLRSDPRNFQHRKIQIRAIIFHLDCFLQ